MRNLSSFVMTQTQAEQYVRRIVGHVLVCAFVVVVSVGVFAWVVR
jgi:hypothetical protein